MYTYQSHIVLGYYFPNRTTWRSSVLKSIIIPQHMFASLIGYANGWQYE